MSSDWTTANTSLATFYAGDESCSDAKKIIKYASYVTNTPKTHDD